MAPGFSDKVGEAHVDIVARLDQLERDLEKGKKQTDKAAKSMDSSFKRITRAIGGAKAAIGGFAAALGVYAGARSLDRAIRANLDFVDSIDKAAGKLGVTTEFFQEAEYAASQSGVAFEQVSTAIQYVARNASDASRGIGEAKDTFKELGIELKNANGTLKDTETLFTESMRALAGVEIATDRVGFAMRIFGRSGAAILNMVDNFEDLGEKARRLGLIVDESIIKRGVEAKDTLDTLARIVQANLSGALVDLAPMLIGIGEHLAYVAKWAAEAWKWLSDILNLQPHTLDEMKERAGELEQEIARLQVRLKNWSIDRQLERIAPKVSELMFLLKQISDEEERLAKGPAQPSQTPSVANIEVPDELLEKHRELWEAREKALDQWTTEAERIQDTWDGLSDSAAASMSRMVADGEISFKALGQAFVREFTQRVLESLVFSRIFSLLGQGLQSLFSTGATTQYGPFSSGYQLDPAHSYLNIGSEIYSGAGTTGGGVGATSVQIFNTTGAPTTAQTGLDGSARIFIGQQGAQDIWSGGALSNAIETKYGLTAKGVRR